MPLIKDAAKRERNTQKFFGCSEARAIELNGGFPLRSSGHPASKYLYQRQAASARGIGWEITFPEWLAVWSASGKWCARGKGGDSYCMARFGDTGPYRVGNVSIQTVRENSRDGIKKARPAMALAPQRLAGGGRGWTFRTNSKKNPYQVCVGAHYVGSFPTQAEAEAAYRNAACFHNESFLVSR